MDAPKIQISQLLSETTKDCDNIVITVLCLSVTKEIPCCETLRKTNHLHIIQNFLLSHVLLPTNLLYHIYTYYFELLKFYKHLLQLLDFRSVLQPHG